jgi:hypothetical protein
MKHVCYNPKSNCFSIAIYNFEDNYYNVVVINKNTQALHYYKIKRIIYDHGLVYCFRSQQLSTCCGCMGVYISSIE